MVRKCGSPLFTVKKRNFKPRIPWNICLSRQYKLLHLNVERNSPTEKNKFTCFEGVFFVCCTLLTSWNRSVSLHKLQTAIGIYKETNELVSQTRTTGSSSSRTKMTTILKLSESRSVYWLFHLQSKLIHKPWYSIALIWCDLFVLKFIHICIPLCRIVLDRFHSRSQSAHPFATHNRFTVCFLLHRSHFCSLTHPADYIVFVKWFEAFKMGLSHMPLRIRVLLLHANSIVSNRPALCFPKRRWAA